MPSMNVNTILGMIQYAVKEAREASAGDNASGKSVPE